MVLYARAASKGLVPAAAVATTSICWVGEKSSSKVVSTKISNEGLSLLTRTLRQQQQQIRMLSTTTRKSMSTTTTTAATAEAVGATTASTATKKGGFSFLQWYEGHLTARPVVTKMCTGTLLWGIGDAVAQLVPPMFYPTEDSNQNDIEYDFQRTGRAMFFGFVIHAPTSHVHYNFLEWLTVRLNVKGLKIPIFKAFMEQFVYWSWISNSMYHGAMGAMQGLSTDQITNRISDVLWETQKAQWVFWIPVQLINFQFVPVRHQLNIVLLTSIVWTALLSAWYPPVTATEEKETEMKEEDVTSSSPIVVEATSTKES